MRRVHIFTDGSVNTKTGIGYGAYFFVFGLCLPTDFAMVSVKTKRFEHTSSTKLELETLLWALNEIQSQVAAEAVDIAIYTDSQNIIGLPARRVRLERQNYVSSKGKRLKNYLLYQAFYKVISKYKCQLIKVKGHQPKIQVDNTARLFGLVDQASRRALRREYANTV